MRQRTPRATVSILSLILSASLPGCLESLQTITLNPDASGKIVLEEYTNTPKAASAGASEPNRQKLSEASLKGLIRNAEGVDAWADLNADVVDGRPHIKAVAYFSDITKLKLEGMKRQFSWARGDRGVTLTQKLGSRREAKPRTLSEKEVQAAAEKAKKDWQQNKPMAEAILGTLKFDTTYVLPGQVQEVEGFTKIDGSHLRLVLEGKRLLEYMDKVMADDQMLTEIIKTGLDPVKDGPSREAVMDALFGTKSGACTAAIGGELKPLFDYKAEMENAKAKQPEMMKKLRLLADDPK